MNPATLAAATILLIGICFAAMGHAHAQDAQAGNQLQVKFAGSTAEPYTVFLDSSSKYTISQSHSWFRDEASRYNLVAYSIDEGAYNEIPRKARGSFALDVPADSDHTVIFQASVQYPLSAVTTSEENLEVIYSPPSPTGDDWFDAGSQITITVPDVEDSKLPGIRQHVVSWSLDNSKRVIEGDFESSFTTPPIQMDAPHQLKFFFVTQYYVNVASAHGTAAGGGWYDDGTTATVSVSKDDDLLILHVFDGWYDRTGLYSEAMSETFLVDSPKTLTARWTLDYSRLMIVSSLPIAAAGAIFLLRKRSSKAAKRTSEIAHAPTIHKFRQQVSASAPLLAFQQRPEITEEGMAAGNADNSNYSKEIMHYALQKSIEKLEGLRSSGLVSDAKFSRVVGKLELAFD
ncbi:MAG: hypothetical protein ACREAZ_09945 [Nitrososphaera sp.]